MGEIEIFEGCDATSLGRLGLFLRELLGDRIGFVLSNWLCFSLGLKDLIEPRNGAPQTRKLLNNGRTVV